MATQVTNYQCPACTGPLHFVGESGRLECDYCGSSFDIAEIEAFYAEKEAKAAEAAQKREETEAAQKSAEAEEQKAAADGSDWDASGLSEDWGADAGSIKAYCCPSCGAELLAHTARTGLPISDLVLANERTWRGDAEIRAGLLHIWSVMRECVERGIRTTGVLPGGLKVRRRANELHRRLQTDADESDSLHAMEWVTLFALAVNEENAAGGRVVTAPTNGAAGIVPAVLHYGQKFLPTFSDDDAVRFLLTAGAIGLLFKENASISGAEVGCQGEVGSACSMAAAGLAEIIGGT